MRHHVARDPRGDDGDAQVYPAHGRGPVRAQGGAEVPPRRGSRLLRVRKYVILASFSFTFHNP